MTRFALLAAFASLTLASAASCADKAPAAPVYAYRLGPGDKIKITVYGEDKLSGEYVIGGDGRISFPLVGMVRGGGMTIGELTTILTRTLGAGYLLHPNVAIEIASYRPVFILGEVQKPGQYPYSENMTIYGLVAQAGGFTYRASRKSVRIRREGEQDETRRSMTSSTPVEPGDTVRIVERYF